MVAIQGNEITSIPLKDTAGRVKTVPPDHALVRGARLLGTSFGD
jgi:6-phosphofructokinase 1